MTADAAAARAASQASGPAVILIGPPGAGKTTVASALGKRLGLPVRDTDADVIAETGRSIGDIFTQDGEAAFRALERAAVARAVAEHRGVLSLGGGAVMDPETQRVLAGQRVVYLALSMSVGVKRTGMSDRRPMFVGVNARAMFKALLEARVPVYRSVAALEIDTDALTVAEVVQRVIDGLGLEAA